MKIRVTKARGSNWYNNHIGEVFNVLERGLDGDLPKPYFYYVDHPDNTKSKMYFVEKRDCEVVEEPKSPIVKVGDKIRIIRDSSGHTVPIGKEIIVDSVNVFGTVFVKYLGRERRIWIEDYEKVTDQVELIANLSAEVARLSKRVAELERKSYVEERKSLVKLRKPLTREEVIEKAKVDVATLIKQGYSETDNPLPDDCSFRGYVYNVEFKVDRSKRKVTALVFRTLLNKTKPVSVARAKCSPDDVFNAHIGRAISLRRALGLDVPKEYLNAPKPEGVEIGDVVKWSDYSNSVFKITDINVDKYSFEVITSKLGLIPKYINGITYEEGIERYCNVIDDTDRVAK